MDQQVRVLDPGRTGPASGRKEKTDGDQYGRRLEASAEVAISSVLEFQHVELTFAERGKTVLHDISFSVAENTVVSVIGPSGCGKTTLLNLAAGLLQPTDGAVHFRSSPLAGVNTAAAYVTQDANLLPWLTVAGNIGLPLKMRGVPSAERADRVNDWIARVGLTGFEKHFPRELSGGMQKRCTIARALIYEPGITLMDEPFGPLDAITRLKLQQELLEIFDKTQQSVIFVTHDLNEAVGLGDKVIVMSGTGEIRDTIEVGISRPRSIPDMAHDPHYQEKCQYLAEFFMEDASGS